MSYIINAVEIVKAGYLTSCPAQTATPLPSPPLPSFPLLTAVLPGRAEHLSGSGLEERLRAQRSRTAQRATFTDTITHASARAAVTPTWIRLMGLLECKEHY